MRKFYLTYSKTKSLISQSEKTKSLISKSKFTRPLIRQSEVAKSNLLTNAQSVIAQFGKLFRLSWTHYIFLIRIENEEERNFYEIETANNNWSVREFQRQFNSSLYERLALSKDKKKVKELGRKGQIIAQPIDMLKEPYILEFLGLKEESVYTETELETALINKLEHFLLELGKGFLFQSRQQRITFNRENFYIDLVFYKKDIKMLCPG